MEVSSVVPAADHCVYTSCYCEENVWKLCDLVRRTCTDEEMSKCYTVFVSNQKQKIPMWYQRARKAENMPVIWDYHVIFIYKHKGGSLVYDLDTLLPFPCSFQQYMAACIGENSLLKPEFWRMFRIIPAAEFLTRFASDRTHMLKEDGAWLAPPPDYPPICTEECSSNLQDCISMDPSQGFGDVVHLVEFIALFDSKS